MFYYAPNCNSYKKQPSVSHYVDPAHTKETWSESESESESGSESESVSHYVDPARHGLSLVLSLSLSLYPIAWIQHPRETPTRETWSEPVSGSQSESESMSHYVDPDPTRDPHERDMVWACVWFSVWVWVDVPLRGSGSHERPPRERPSRDPAPTRETGCNFRDAFGSRGKVQYTNILIHIYIHMCMYMYILPICIFTTCMHFPRCIRVTRKGPTHKHTHTHIHTHVSVCTCIYCMFTSMHALSTMHSGHEERPNTQTYTYTYAHIHVFSRGDSRGHKYLCYTYIQTHTHTHTHTHMHTYMYLTEAKNSFPHVAINISATHTNTHTHIHIHIYTHTCIQQRRRIAFLTWP
jgi:hypothetical protein